MFSLMLIILAIALVLQGIKKHVLRIPEPDPSAALKELEMQEWFIALYSDPENKMVIDGFKKDGPLSDANTIKRLITHEGARIGFIRYVEEKHT
ncbi:hypothetical protein ACFQPF_03125 [Fictibacillus iocasae]|uniref:Uncharacterized protein n=1 Tax=Fictibacillus iocasae TaxID=2715437 RepID=A0ABW2NN78_9BACL